MEPDVNTAPLSEEQTPAEVVTDAAPEVIKPGEKTDPALLLESLQKEKAKRRELETALEAEKAKANIPQGEVFSDEGKLLQGQILNLQAKLEAEEKAKQLANVEATYPVLRDKSDEFEQFKAENPGMKIETAAKAFLIENDLLEAPRARKGLESASGGGRTPVQTGMTPEDIENLRVNNYNEYARRIRAGTLK